jgi:hypothetical protein
VAAFVSSIVWRVVGRAVEEGDPQSYGWAYGWAALALLLIMCGTLMVFIMEIYFIGGGWRHHLVQHDRRSDDNFPDEIPRDLNGSWMEDEIIATGLSLEDSSIKRRGGIRILSRSAIEFLSPPRSVRQKGSLLTIVDSRDEEDVSRVREADLLGIDDDGSLLYPLQGSERREVYNTTNQIVHPPQLFDAESSTEVSGEYLSFTGIKETKKCQLTFTKSEDESSVRATSIFDYPESAVSDGVNSNMYNSRDNREAKTPSPIDSFSL